MGLHYKAVCGVLGRYERPIISGAKAEGAISAALRYAIVSKRDR